MDGFIKMFGHIANILKGYAIAVGVVVAIGFVMMWWRHRQSDAAAERTIRIQALLADQMRLALAHPDLARPPAGGHAKPEDQARYDWYLQHLLALAGQILVLDRAGASHGAVAEHLALHREALSTDYFRHRSQTTVTADVRRLIAKTITAQTKI